MRRDRTSWRPRSGRDLHAAEAGGLHRYLRSGQGQVEALLDEGGLHRLATPGQAFVQPVQAPEVVGMLAGAAELAVEAEIRAIDRLGLGDPALFQQQRAEGVA